MDNLLYPLLSICFPYVVSISVMLGTHCNQIGMRPCLDIPHSVCDTSYLCVCESGYYQDGGQCSHGSENVTSLARTVLGFGGVIIVIVLAIVICTFERRPARQQPSPRTHPLNGLEMTTRVYSIQGPCVRIDLFPQYVDQMLRAPGAPLAKEFMKLQASVPHDLTTNIGRLQINDVKNRFVNAIPYDHTRVKLTTSTPDKGDYINASYILGPRSTCDYIATQGPMFSTIPDFWRMISEHRSGIIVMLSDFSEEGKHKLDKYWPDYMMNPVRYGDVIVEVTSCSSTVTMTTRKIRVSMSGQENLSVTHFYLPGWKNIGYTLGLHELFEVINVVRTRAPSNQGPITVHCSAGIGRTGMFLTLDICTRLLLKLDVTGFLDVPAVVKKLLQYRPCIIQSQEQYIFIHKALSAIIQRRDFLASRNLPGRIYNPTADHAHENDHDKHLYISLDEIPHAGHRI